uniref:Uncharacterized protein n=1 Tax=Megaselia scalaris TaxID=36166 RepID=T1GYI0_MEGSC
MSRAFSYNSKRWPVLLIICDKTKCMLSSRRKRKRATASMLFTHCLKNLLDKSQTLNAGAQSRCSTH